jgi:hypothetical protein
VRGKHQTGSTTQDDSYPDAQKSQTALPDGEVMLSNENYWQSLEHYAIRKKVNS